MRLRRIKVLAIVAPAVGLIAFEILRHYVIQPATGERSPHIAEHLISGAVLLVGVVVFTFAIFRLLERLHDQLLAVNEAAIAVTADLSVDSVLERVAELARKVAGTPYASVHVEGERGRTVASGTPPPAGRTLVHPIVVKGERLGDLVLVSPSGSRFRSSDEKALETFATQAGIALENARLFEQVHELVASRERLRIGMDLHDGVIQELYGLGLRVEDAAELAPSEPERAAEMIREVHGGLRGVIGEIRTYVYGLRDGDRSVELRPALERLVAEFGSSGPAVALEVAGDARLPAAAAANVLHIVREALANSIRHAAASRILVEAVAGERDLRVSVEDDGRGFEPDAPSSGLGIGDMRERAAWCSSELSIRSSPGDGTLVRVRVPVESGEAAGVIR